MSNCVISRESKVKFKVLCNITNYLSSGQIINLADTWTNYDLIIFACTHIDNTAMYCTSMTSIIDQNSLTNSESQSISWLEYKGNELGIHKNSTSTSQLKIAKASTTSYGLLVYGIKF